MHSVHTYIAALNTCGEGRDCLTSSNNNFTCVCPDGLKENSNSVCVDFNECVPRLSGVRTHTGTTPVNLLFVLLLKQSATEHVSV